jgi:hypothetical protein
MSPPLTDTLSSNDGLAETVPATVAELAFWLEISIWSAGSSGEIRLRPGRAHRISERGGKQERAITIKGK